MCPVSHGCSKEGRCTAWCSSAQDVAKMTAKLLEDHVCKEDHERQGGPVFQHPLIKGTERVGCGWIKAFVKKHSEQGEEIERISENFQYEL